MARDDHYAVLGLTPTVQIAEIRRAYRLLALRHHPDRAGPDGTATFQRIAEAYRVLSDPELRSSYDAGRSRPPERAAARTQAAASPAVHAEVRPAPAAAASTATLILRLCGTVDALTERGILRPHPAGILELHVKPEEARLGGVAAINLPLTVPCPTCGGVAGGDVWCRRCQFQGSVVEQVTLCLPIPAAARDGLMFNLELDRLGDLPPMTVRLRVG
ncbi:MAG TPA: J domain-containing protein [Polyangia bacterium]|jgi:DnaJ-class molecular chaperone|nr:J domain-containing protein [Polyangia bacterium]